MATKKKALRSSDSARDPLQLELDEISDKLGKAIEEFQQLRGSNFCFPLLLGSTSIDPSIVDDIYDDLLAKNDEHGKIDVLVESERGDLNAAYNLENLLRKFGKDELELYSLQMS